MEQKNFIKVLACGMCELIPVAIAVAVSLTTDSCRVNTWVNVFFSVIAYAIAVVVCLPPVKKELATLNWTVYAISALFFILQLLVSVAYLYIMPDYPLWAFVVHLLLNVGFIVFIGLLYIYIKYTESQMKYVR